MGRCFRILSLEWGKRRTVSCVPTALNRLYCLFISPSIVNLGCGILILKKQFTSITRHNLPVTHYYEDGYPLTCY